MLKGLITSAGKIYSWVWSLILVVLFGYLAWGSWHLYNNEKEFQQFIKEGQPVKVQVTATDRENRVWYDQFYDKVYITFNHNGQTYNTRYIQDSGWVNVGDNLTLLYHPQYNAFRQATKQIHFKERTNRSRLLEFSFISMWNDERKWLLLTLLLATTCTLIAMGMISSLVQIPLLTHAGKLIFTAGLIGVALYLTYNSWQYHQYFNKVKNGSAQKTVTIISTDYHNHSRRGDSWWVTYEAWVQDGTEQRTIPLEKDDYDKLKANDQLPVLYNHELNDMMPVNYTGDNMNIWATLFFWMFAIFFLWQNYFKRRAGKNAIN